MKNRYYLTPSHIIGGVYSPSKQIYTFFIPGGCCVVPVSDLIGVKFYEDFKNCPENFIQYVTMHGLDTSIVKTSLDEPNNNSKYIKLS